MIEERKLGDRIADVIIWIVLAALGLICVLPFLNVIAMSLSGYLAVSTGKVSFWPIDFTWDNYGYMLTDQVFVGSFRISVLRVIFGVAVNLLVTAVTAYPLSRDMVHMPGRTVFKMVMLFGMMFGGGLIPTFMAYKALGLLNKFAVFIIPGALNVFFTIVIINFFRGLPNELWESAVLDGANDAQILFRIFLPLSLPSLATIALFSAVGHWNSWFDGIVFMQLNTQWPLQSYLYSQVTTRTMAWNTSGRQVSEKAALEYQNATPEALAMAMIVIAALPIMSVYPFLQRFFVTGLTLGSVKG